MHAYRILPLRFSAVGKEFAVPTKALSAPWGVGLTSFSGVHQEATVWMSLSKAFETRAAKALFMACLPALFCVFQLGTSFLFFYLYLSLELLFVGG